MPIERAADHPTFELGEIRITSLTAPARGSLETALFRADLPPGAEFPPHRHDHFDIFTVLRGGATLHLDDESFDLLVDDSAVVPIGARHYLQAGDGGASIVVAMRPQTLLIREGRPEVVPEWVR